MRGASHLDVVEQSWTLKWEAFLTTWITTDGYGARGNSGYKSVKEEEKPNENR